MRKLPAKAPERVSAAAHQESRQRGDARVWLDIGALTPVRETWSATGPRTVALRVVADKSRPMGIVDRLTSVLLQSPLHPILSRSTDLVRYTGHRSGREITTPTQYAQLGDDVIMLVANHDDRTWWRNIRTDRDLEVLVRGEWLTMSARAVIGADEPEVIAPLLDTYLARFPKTGRLPGDGTPAERAQRAVMVWCRPR